MGWAKQLEKHKKKKKDMPGSMPEVDLTGRPQYTGKRLTLGATEGFAVSALPLSSLRVTMTCDQVYESCAGVHDWFGKIVPCHH